MNPDISVIINGKNSSLDAAIEFCKRCNVTVEVLEDQMNAVGYYVAVCDTKTFYEEYYLHYQWVALEYRNNKCDRFKITKAVVFEKDTDEFFVGDASNYSMFYRRMSDVKKSTYFKEDKVFMMSTMSPLKEMYNEALPDDNVLGKYQKFFSELLSNE